MPNRDATLRAAYAEGFADARKDSCGVETTDDDLIDHFWSTSRTKVSVAAPQETPKQEIEYTAEEVQALRDEFDEWLAARHVPEAVRKIVQPWRSEAPEIPPLDLEPIKARLSHVTADGAVSFLHAYIDTLAVRDVPILIAEVERLRAALQGRPSQEPTS